MGLAYVAPIGLQNLFVINSALTQKRSRVYITALIVIFWDISLGVSCFLGAGALMQALPWLQKVILCVGEVLSERKDGITSQIVCAQTEIALGGVSAEELKNIVIAYEPVWAIGTGETATPEQANEVCAVIRSLIERLYGKDAADAVVVQYGGSMNDKNAAELLAQPDVDGGLIGGASLVAEKFTAIVNAASAK